MSGLPPRPYRSPEKGQRLPQSPARPLPMFGIRKPPPSPGQESGDEEQVPNPMAGLDPRKYRLTPIAQTERSTVYKVIDITTAEPVAVRKYIYYLNETGRRDLEKEIRTYEWLEAEHPEYKKFILPFRKASPPRSPDVYIDFEWLEGQDLFYYVESLNTAKPADFKKVTALLSDVASAILYCHSIGLTHTDIKAENIYVADGKAYLFDLGTALIGDYAYRQTEDANQYIALCSAICRLWNVALPNILENDTAENRITSWKVFLEISRAPMPILGGSKRKPSPTRRKRKGSRISRQRRRS